MMPRPLQLGLRLGAQLETGHAPETMWLLGHRRRGGSGTQLGGLQGTLGRKGRRSGRLGSSTGYRSVTTAPRVKERGIAVDGLLLDGGVNLLGCLVIAGGYTTYSPSQGRTLG